MSTQKPTRKTTAQLAKAPKGERPHIGMHARLLGGADSKARR